MFFNRCIFKSNLSKRFLNLVLFFAFSSLYASGDYLAEREFLLTLPRDIEEWQKYTERLYKSVECGFVNNLDPGVEDIWGNIERINNYYSGYSRICDQFKETLPEQFDEDSIQRELFEKDDETAFSFANSRFGVNREGGDQVPKISIFIAQSHLLLANILSKDIKYQSLSQLHHIGAALHYFRARALICENICNELGAPELMESTTQLNHMKIMEYLQLVHTASLEEEDKLRRNGLSLLSQKLRRMMVEKAKGEKKAIQRKQIVNLGILLFEHIDELAAKGTSREEFQTIAADAIYMAYDILIKIYKEENRSFNLSKQHNIPWLKLKVDLVLALRNHFESFGDVYGYQGCWESIKGFFFDNLLLLCYSLLKHHTLDISEEERYEYFSYVLNIWSEISSIPGRTENTDIFFMGFAIEAAILSPDHETEKKYLDLAYDNLPKISDNETIFDFYQKKSRVDIFGDNKKTFTKSDNSKIFNDTVARAETHLMLLGCAGDFEEIERLMATLQESKKRNKRQKKTMSHDKMVATIRAEQEALRLMKERLDEQCLELKERAERKLKSPELWQDQPYWHAHVHSDEGGRGIPQAQIRRDTLATLKNLEEEEEARQEDNVPNLIELVSVDEEVLPYTIPEVILDALEQHRNTFEAIFHTGKSVQSIQRKDFLNLIIALGGTLDSEKGHGSHVFVTLKLGETSLDIEALDEKSAAELRRNMGKANSLGTMTLSWPRKNRGHSRRFLTPEQVKQAKLLLIANGLTPGLVFNS